MKNVNLFTERLDYLTRISAKISRATITKKDAEALEKLRDKLPEEVKYMQFREYVLLRDLAKYLIIEARETLETIEAVKQIEREILQARREEKRRTA